jgi:TDG/mug DNA glycosylase family protein
MSSSCFPPIASPTARILILGSLPGTLSLERNQYYAHPRNIFWPFMQQLMNIPATAPYQERTHLLQQKGIALWDVCATAHRPGSLDSRIAEATITPNDFATFLRAHPSITLIAFNGAKAEDIFRRRVLQGLPLTAQSIPRTTLPSTSPANARMKLEDKLHLWRTALLVTSPARQT